MPSGAESRFPQFAKDLIKCKRKETHFPAFFVSKSDIELQRERGKTQIPIRNQHGERLQAIWEKLPTQKQADSYAKRNGWPFSCHLANFDSDEYEKTENPL